jgi:chemotaxis protein MotA
MDPATLAGIGLAFFAIFGSMVIEGGNPAALLVPAPIFLVFAGTLGVAMASGLMKDTTSLVAVLKSALLAKPTPPDATIKTVVSLADKARHDGLLALEPSLAEIEDPFLKKGIGLAIDGTDPEELREILENEIHSMKARHKNGAKFFENMGGFAPTLGILGTVIGLVHVLQNLSDPGKLGPLISSAFIATLWGVMSANIMWLPIANRLKRVSEVELHHCNLILEGVLSIQAGANPRVIEERLLAHFPAKQREALGRDKAA